ncbi:MULTISPECIES: hypothetical protein [unclassified Curtobacterium]|uniref:hypothetical protein n=1 Tax=unclassified Curtobacterium TaxID=257496 RepID=UPI000D964915|nr:MULTISPECIES: hypothetical protein [unclassified Curtobacterium]PYY60148.1 hypothetical protein DEJ30_17410 [Curtobacterium sp. MCPF17_003]PZE65241.1 hypothetical protein DEJ27_14760 [Curtobacterium sp. MCPF17_018]PZF31568.1 hypothetical protein DEJ35_06090 [Curtobacterium sp. MCPF17_051]WIB70418.1 hypothetical protein DEI85_14900 [Curtobacterium sp. MCBD17_026]
MRIISNEGLVVMTATIQNAWHRHGLRSPEDLAALVAERLEGTGHQLVSFSEARYEPTYADFLGEQL